MKRTHIASIIHYGETHMKQTKYIFTYALLILLLLPTLALAANEPRLHLVVAQPNLAVNEQTTVEVMVEDAVAVYGTEIRLHFDPDRLEVVQLTHCDFLSSDPDNEAFVLQNSADNEIGTVDYALALLNPAPPVDGSGLLLQVTFKAKAEGPTLIEFENGLFGTQAGEEIVPTTEDIELNVAGVGNPGTVAAQTSTAANGVSTLTLSLIAGGVLLALLGLFVIVVIAIWFSRRRKQAQPARY